MRIFSTALIHATVFGVLGCSSDVAVTKITSELAVDPEISDLGRVPTGVEQTAQLKLNIIGGTGASINIVDILVENFEGDYFFFDEPEVMPTVVSGAGFDLDIGYLPSVSGLHLAVVTVIGDSSPLGIEVDVRAQAVDARLRVTPTLMDFGLVEVGEIKTDTAELINESAVSLLVTDVLFEDDSFVLATPLPLEIEAEGTAVLNILCRPSSVGPLGSLMSLTIRGGVPSNAVTLIANDCDRGDPAEYDLDHDGFTSCAEDCDDTDATVNPVAVETCDGLDNDCDGTTDEETTCYDDDGDGRSEDEGDCNDFDEAIGPHAEEVNGNGVDDDCDGVVDFAVDDDDDDGYAVEGGDCDDSRPDTHPDAVELPDGVDNDCDGIVDEGTTLYDDDGDGFTEEEGDCSDSDISRHPDAVELADWVDNDCDGIVDEGTDHYDDDEDGYSEDGGDCDDSDDTIRPGVVEISGDDVDNDCDGIIE